MRIYNGTDTVYQYPLGKTTLVLKPREMSCMFVPDRRFLTLVSTTATSKELSIVPDGMWETEMCSGFPTIASMVVGKLDEAIARFVPKDEEKKPTENPPIDDEVKVLQKPVEDETDPNSTEGGNDENRGTGVEEAPTNTKKKKSKK